MDFSGTPEEKLKFTASGTVTVGKVNVTGTVTKETGKPVQASGNISLTKK
jgi:hypothetical protein